MMAVMTAMYDGNFYNFKIKDLMENINQPILEEGDFKDEKHRIIFTTYTAKEGGAGKDASQQAKFKKKGKA